MQRICWSQEVDGMTEDNEHPRAGWEEKIKKDLEKDPDAGKSFWPESDDDEKPEGWTWDFD